MAACDGVVWEIQARGVSLLQRRASGRTVFRTMPWMAVLFLAVPLGVIAGSVTIMVKASGADQPAVVALFAVLALIGLALAAFFVRVMRPVTLTRSALRIPPSGFKTVVIPLNDVAGVGLLYCVRRPPDRSPSAWYVYVWRRNGSVQRVNGLRCRKPADIPSSQVAASRAGRTVRRLDSKIRAGQGPTGNLATLELQKQGRVGPTDNLVAFWSPDGDMGPTRDCTVAHYRPPDVPLRRLPSGVARVSTSGGHDASCTAEKYSNDAS
jgi:hypothetical protein